MIIQTDMNPKIITPAPAAGKCVQMCKVHFHIYLPGQNLNVFPLKQTHGHTSWKPDMIQKLKRYRAVSRWKSLERKKCQCINVFLNILNITMVISHSFLTEKCTILQYFNITGDFPVSFARLLHLIPWTSSHTQSIIVYNFWWLMTSENFPHVSFLKRLSCR